MGNYLKVPSIYSYSPAPGGEEQWGDDTSPDAITMGGVKLELELQEKTIDELYLTLQVLEGTHGLSFDYISQYADDDPEYTCKNPAEIIQDYMTKVFEHVDDALNLRVPVRSKIPMDIVITVPVVSKALRMA